MDPLGSEHMLFDTGDLGFVDKEGHLNILGRRDRQLKLRGIRMEPEGIETALGRCPGVHKAAVVATEKPALLVALVAGKDISESAVVNFSERELASHMRPQKVFVLPLDAWPQLPNGKTDLKTLAERATSMVVDEDSVQQVVDSLGQMKAMSRKQLEMKRIFDILLAACTIHMVHYHVNSSIGGVILAPIRFDDFQNRWLQFWMIDEPNADSEWNTIGFVFAGALNDALDTATAHALGVREVLIVFVYALWVFVLPQCFGTYPGGYICSGPTWYLLMLMLSKLILLGFRHVQASRTAQLIAVCFLPYALLFPFPGGFIPSILKDPWVSMFNGTKLTALTIYCVTFLFAPEISQILHRCRDFKGLAVLPMAGLFVLSLYSLSVLPEPGVLSDCLRVFLLACTVATAPSQLKLTWIANGSLGSFMVSAGILIGTSLELDVWRVLFGPVPKGAVQLTLCDAYIILKMLANVLLVVMVVGPFTMKMLVWTLRATAQVASLARSQFKAGLAKSQFKAG